MPRTPDVSDLTDLHLLILGAIWARDECSIADVHEAIGSRGVSTKTIATILSRLEKRKLVSHRMKGREGIYRALVTRKEVLVSRVGGVLESLFAAEEGVTGAAALNRKDVRDGDSKRLVELLRKAEQDVRGKR
jgi:BlaI family transcriptional regulator, penicillinase repressor